VVPYYERFIKKYSSWESLSKASFSDVYTLWQGLGYNRRAKALRDLASIVVKKHRGQLPRSIEELIALPGIGPYTARAIATFAYNESHIFIETNIRTVYLQHFFKGLGKISDQKLLPLIEATLPKSDTRSWYFALMDYGASLKRSGIRLNHRNPIYRPQTKFEGSPRQLRGQILKALSAEMMSTKKLAKNLSTTQVRLRFEVARLLGENLVREKRGLLGLP